MGKFEEVVHVNVLHVSGHHEATTMPPAPQVRGEREAGNNVLGSPGGKSRNTYQM
jgi:hypothetical protein